MGVRGVVLGVLAVVFVVWSILPLYYITIAAFMWETDVVTRPPAFIPRSFTLTHLLRILGFPAPGPTGEMLRPAGYPVLEGLTNSLIVAAAVTAITMIAAVPAGYVLGRYQVPRRNAILMLIIGSRTLPPIAIVIPYFIMYKTLGLWGTHLGLILAHLALAIPLITWVLMGFFATLPRELEKQARIDGYSRFGAFARIVLPVAAPGIATCAILAFLTSWNEFVMAWMLATGSPAQTLPTVLATMFTMNIGLPLFAVANFLAILPAILVAVILQRHITRLRIVDPLTVVVS
ncbi:MAG TPA: carbohydrate ABC transporter permease [Candidatus Bathyarchaeota archaeon]|nr:carbohydrate ABC transporter permease [Candidatus Bathyarchaeota archaeon]HEX68983.1 carbohydrate ABC transporter permease [Candidatus Bathyarchaeota archaeon]